MLKKLRLIGIAEER